MIIKHRSFRFVKPELISETEYNQLKKDFTKNPKLDISPKTSFLALYSKEIKNIFIIPISIIVILKLLNWITSWNGFETMGLVVLTFVAFHFFLKYIWEWGSYLNFYIDKKLYYKNLKRRVLNSDDYQHMRKKYWFWVNLHLNR